MKTLQMDENTARRLYPNAAKEFKEMLDQNFGKGFFSMNIMERVNNFDDILSISGKTMADLQKAGDTEDEVAYKQIKLIAEVYNEGTVLNALDTSQYKYYPWHKVSGSGLSCGDCAGWHSFSNVGVRLCFKSAAHAVDAGKKFIDIYTKLKIK